VENGELRISLATDESPEKGGKVLKVEFERLNEQVSPDSIQLVMATLNEGIRAKLGNTTPLPQKTTLLSNYPNPFNPETWIPYRLANDLPVTISIYNAKGQPVRIINLGAQEAGNYVTKDKAALWNGRNQVGEKVASGVYFYTLQAGDFVTTRKMLILK